MPKILGRSGAKPNAALSACQVPADRPPGWGVLSRIERPAPRRVTECGRAQFITGLRAGRRRAGERRALVLWYQPILDFVLF